MGGKKSAAKASGILGRAIIKKKFGAQQQNIDVEFSGVRSNLGRL
jgi:hypothetical protein